MTDAAAPSASSPLPSAPPPTDLPVQARVLFALLTRAAADGTPCPSNFGS
ncbi:hypothetical protein [Roseospira goensis]|uniref:Uncharacterized protein n=1 Tax=Roseospira goensis TaxID=391922 RepID=A0A7W6S2A2_9PROT|nr:hypothetical protein [Roseospira goensis]MBB4287524.1 hypothetical protein [Roseospira goensis]